jgi:hypothetical protein
MNLYVHLMRTFAVGELYNPSKRRWLEGVQYSFREHQHELLLFLKSPTRREIDAVRRETTEFSLTIEPPLIVLCYRFGDGIPWSDAPFTYHLVPANQRTLPDEANEVSEFRALLLVFLVDADTGIILAMRQITFSAEFTARLHLAIREQARMTWDEAEYNRLLANLYRRCSTDALVETAAARCKGGE